MNIKNKYTFIIILALAAALQIGLLSPVRDFTLWVLSPVLSVARNAGVAINSTISSAGSRGDLKSDNAELQQIVNRLEAENASLKSTLSDHEAAVKALGFKERSGYSLVGGKVVSADPANLNQNFLVDRGSDDGVVRDQAVVDAAGAYVGRVSAVFKNTAEVSLISSTISRLPSEVLDSGARGIVRGEYGLSISLSEVPQGQDLPEGARVVTTSFTPGVPAGLLVGYVEERRSHSNELFQEVSLRPAADLRQLRVIFIITGVK